MATGVGRREDDILRLQIEVDDPLGVDEVDCPENLSRKVAALRFGQLVIGRRNVFEQFAAAEIFGQNDRLLLALEVVHESDDELLEVE